MKSLEKHYTIAAPLSHIWQALIDPKKIADWGAGPAKMNEKNNESFSLWGGEIYGKNVRVEKNKLLEQEWFGGKWEEPSIVTIHLEEIDKNKTSITLVQKHIPDEEEKSIDQGWDDYYFGPLKEYLENK